MTRCPICSKESPEGSRFCPFCGAKLATQSVRKVDPLIGRTLAGKYKVIERIGSGAMGSIYRAEHVALGKPVVIKVLHRHLVGDESHIKRFHREAKAASRLNQPNCITVLDYGQAEDGSLYICMEYVQGKDLCRILYEEKRLAPDRTVRIASQVLDALDEAHNQGVIHRDLKPENIMIEKLRMNPEFVKVLDFGIAKIRDTSGSEADSGTFKTATGMVFGTPEYMSPEQIRGEELDGRSDLYSLGIILYQMLSGDLPFTGETVLEIATKHLREPPVPLHERCPDIPPSLCDVVHCLLRKKRDERYATAAEAKAALEGALRTSAGAQAGRESVHSRTTDQVPPRPRAAETPSAAPADADQVSWKAAVRDAAPPERTTSSTRRHGHAIWVAVILGLLSIAALALLGVALLQP